MQCPPHRRTITGQLPMGPTMDQRAMGHLTITAGHLPITDKRATVHLTMTDKGAMGHLTITAGHPPIMDKRPTGDLTMTAGHLPITDKRPTGDLTMTDKGAMGHRHGRRVGMAIARIRLRIRHRM
jgi:hypothetical protein